MSRRTMIVLFTLSLAATAGPLVGHAQAPEWTVAGSWQGVITAGATQLRLTFDISRSADGVYLGTLGLADQSRQSRRIRVDRIDVNGDSVRLEVAVVRATFTGVITSDRAEIRGAWMEGGVSYPLVLARSDPPTSPLLVSVSGREVEVLRMGEGSPTLVLESGGGESASQWSRILPELAKQTRVITYSRSGFGKSTASPLPGSPQSTVAELHALLQVLGETGPFVLAGHSWGGLLARLYVSTFPTEVVGLVLIDGTHEAQYARWEALDPAFKFADFMRATVSQAPRATRDLVEQVLTVEAAQQVGGMKPIPDLPLAVITAMKPCPPEREWTCRDPRALAVWRQLHDEWSARSTSSLRIVSARTGHYVMNDQPMLIVDAVQFVLDQVRSIKR